MELSKTSMEKFDDAIKSMADFGFSKETVVRALKKLLKEYDGNWEHIEADNYSVLADVILSDSDPEEGQKKRAEKKNLDSDHHRKKLKTKEHGQKTKSCMHGSVKRELAEVPRQQEAESQDPCTFETPLAVMCPKVLEPSCHNGHEDAHMISGVKHSTDKKFKGILVAHEGQMVDACSSQAIVSSKDFSTNFEVELSNYGKGKLSFLFNPSLANGSDFQMPGIESICKAMEVKCLRTYRILEPNFSFMKLLDDTCQCILDLGSGPNDTRETGTVQILPAQDILSKPSVTQPLQSNRSGSSCMHLNTLTRFGGSAASGGNQNNPSNLQVIQHQLPTGIRQYHDVNDITRGEECVSIPIVSGKDGVLPPPFHYISQNTTFQDAYINLSLARIGDENCCSGCFGDCLAEPLPCACARETGGKFAYTRDGLLEEGFLDACVSMLREPLEQSYFYCKGVCPIEQMKKGVNSMKPDACKGHRIKKFIKECWRKCGCTRNCGNRVVQRGITCKLQVFLTPGKKGWGLRSSENLPRGAFVCEYVGEILTNTELYERNTELSGKNNQKTGKAKHRYPVLLDADWGTEGVLKDEEALCLDGTFYGNVARFINHRCFDCNIIAIPVEIETPDHHYYHLAFFTTREVEPFEELTWDYEIDFDDVNHPVKAFKCYCGSKFCRDKRRISRGSKSRALVLS